MHTATVLPVMAGAHSTYLDAAPDDATQTDAELQ